MKTKKRIKLAALLLIALLALSQATLGAEGDSLVPAHTEIVRVLEMQPMPEPQLVYFDQTGADLLGMETIPGRVSLPSFNSFVAGQLGYEIKSGAVPIENPASTIGSNGLPLLFIEKDEFGGAGRAGYIKIGKIWVNGKALGITGKGKTKDRAPGPPITEYASHQWGGMPFDEAIREAVLSRAADAELSSGAGRIIAIFLTGRFMSYPDGRIVPVAAVFRAPMRRTDLGNGSEFAVNESLAQATSLRFYKGDFVNKSNMGAFGEVVDLGCMTFTGGYGPIMSSQGARHGAYFLEEFERDANSSFGRFILNQLGIPEAHLLPLMESEKGAADLEKAGAAFRWMNFGSNDYSRATFTVLDNDPVPLEKLEGWHQIHRILPKLASDFFTRPVAQTRDEWVKVQTENVFHGRFTDFQKGQYGYWLKRFFEPIFDLLSEVQKSNDLGDLAEYAEKIRRIAQFKNRELSELIRPNLVKRSGEISEKFMEDRDPDAVSEEIERLVRENRVGTTPSAESNLIVRANPRETELFIRAHVDASGVARLYAYPDLPGGQMHFRVTTDAWGSYQDLPSELVRTSMGEYFKVSIPHGSMPVTDKPLEYSPFIQHPDGGVQWLKSSFNLKGPPLLINERLGLPANFARRAGGMRLIYKQRISFMPEDLDADGQERIRENEKLRLARMLRWKNGAAVQDATEQLEKLDKLGQRAQESYRLNPALSCMSAFSGQ